VVKAEPVRIGWIGTGVMGASMAGHLLDKGFRLTVYNRTRSKSEPLLARGAQWADSPAGVARAADCTFLIVGHPKDVREVVLGPEGALGAAADGSILVDMTTSEPALAVEIHEAGRRRGVATLDAPVSGGDIGARKGTLSIMVGGEKDTFERVRPLFEHLGATIVHQGPAGAGQHTKLVNQTLIATGLIGVCEALLYAYRAGLDVENVLRSVSGGAAGSWSLTSYAPRMLQGDFAPGFLVEHFVKDMGIVLAEARARNLCLPGLALAHQLYVALAAQGHGRKGVHALLLALARLSDVSWPEGKPAPRAT
jgi:3-hydroxyisobutyrate dehydrogenase